MARRLQFSILVSGWLFDNLREVKLAKIVGKLLLKKKAALATAESCTGGAIASVITDVPGSSRYFERGVVTYSNRSKIDLLKVKKKTLEKFGAVSEQTAKEMAEGIRKTAKTTYGLSVTGVAGPSGGTKQKPVGTVYIGLATPKSTEVRHYCFPKNRLEFKRLVTAAALNWLRARLQSPSPLVGEPALPTAGRPGGWGEGKK